MRERKLLLGESSTYVVLWLCSLQVCSVWLFLDPAEWWTGEMEAFTGAKSAPKHSTAWPATRRTSGCTPKASWTYWTSCSTTRRRCTKALPPLRGRSQGSREVPAARSRSLLRRPRPRRRNLEFPELLPHHSGEIAS